MPFSRRDFLGLLLKGTAVAAVAPNLLLPDDPEFAAWMPKKIFHGYGASELFSETTFMMASFNSLTGYLRIPTPEDRIYIPQGRRLVAEYSRGPQRHWRPIEEIGAFDPISQVLQAGFSTYSVTTELVTVRVVMRGGGQG